MRFYKITNDSRIFEFYGFGLIIFFPRFFFQKLNVYFTQLIAFIILKISMQFSVIIHYDVQDRSGPLISLYSSNGDTGLYYPLLPRI